MKARNTRFFIVFILLLAGYLLLPEGAFAAESEGKWGILLPLGRVFNVGLVIGILVWATRKPLKEFYASRSQMIREQLAEAQQAREDAEAKLAEMQARVSRVDEELAQIKAAAERESKEEYQRLIAEAQRDADKIIARAREEIDGMTRAARQELKSHVAELSVRLAEQKIKTEITDEDRGRLFGRFVSQLGGKG